jgi:phosphoglucomutase
MSESLSPGAGQLAPPEQLLDVDALRAAYFERRPDPHEPTQRVAFGTSGHRGSAFLGSFNEWHLLAIAQAICDYRKSAGIDGPLMIGCDTHASSAPAFDSCLEVLVANEVQVHVSADGEFTPTPAISHAILVHNSGRDQPGRADGIVITPSHNPPEDGGCKYNPPHGGPAEAEITDWIGARANALLEQRLHEVRRIPIERARRSANVRSQDFRAGYVRDLASVVDLQAIRESGLRLGVDPMGGAGVHYWPMIAERHGLSLEVTNPAVDPRFAFVPRDHDGRIRMDPSSPYAMQVLVAQRERFDLSFACDTDHDRHGIVARSGLMTPNNYLAVLASWLPGARPQWPADAAIGKSVVTTALLDRVAKRQGRPLFEAPVGFKWFVPGLLQGKLALACEESAGAAPLRRDGGVWTTDKDGIVPALLSAELMARSGCDPAQLYQRLVAELGEPCFDRVEAPCSLAQKQVLARWTATSFTERELAGEAIERVLTDAPGNGAPIGGVKIETKNGWFAARPSGTEALYRIYAESFIGQAHLQQLLSEAQALVDRALGPAAPAQRAQA